MQVAMVLETVSMIPVTSGTCYVVSILVELNSTIHAGYVVSVARATTGVVLDEVVPPGHKLDGPDPSWNFLSVGGINLGLRWDGVHVKCQLQSSPGLSPLDNFLLLKAPLSVKTPSGHSSCFLHGLPKVRSLGHEVAQLSKHLPDRIRLYLIN